MQLYDYFRSSASFRVRIGLNLKGLAPERHFVHLTRKGGEQFDPEFTRLNPQQLVPVLVDDGTAISQSLAILEYLDETHPEPPLLPRAPLERARVRALALGIACDLHPIDNLRVLFYLRDAMGQSEEARNTWYRHWVAKGLTALEAGLADDPRTGTYCHGDVPGLADICLVPQIFNAKRFDCPLDGYRTVMRVFDNCMAHPAFDAAQPSKQPDAE
jgi:maleylacetoacetate isomerase